MAEAPSSEPKDKESPAPEVLKPQVDEKTPAPETPVASIKSKIKSNVSAKLRRGTYRPSHKATFIGLSVVVAILVINAGIFAFLMKSQGDANSQARKGEVTLSSETLDKLGVSRNPVGNPGTELVINPNSRFNGKVMAASDVNIAGELKLNNKLSAADASLAKLQAGDTSVQQLNVNGDGTLSSLSLRKDMNVAGVTRLQGSVTIGQLLTVNNNVNIAGSLSVGGTLTVRSFSISNLDISGRITTHGSAPGVSRGGAAGSNGTASISGNDAAGTVAVNTGTGAGNGILASVTFRSRYGTTPHVVITPVGIGGNFYVNRSAIGFSIGVSGALGPGGYAFDYIVMQ
ncbi:MAG: hypothetical protein ACREGJ_04820 [Candidatus Saccharimonadales bacterium]